VNQSSHRFEQSEKPDKVIKYGYAIVPKYSSSGPFVNMFPKMKKAKNNICINLAFCVKWCWYSLLIERKIDARDAESHVC